MSTTITSVLPVEEGTAVVTIAFKDEDGSAVTPSAATWTLTDGDGTVINSRNQVAIGSLAASVNVVLKGDDLSLAAGSGTTRKFLVEYTYTSNLGSGLPGKAQLIFSIEDLAAVT